MIKRSQYYCGSKEKMKPASAARRKMCFNFEKIGSHITLKRYDGLDFYENQEKILLKDNRIGLQRGF